MGEICALISAACFAASNVTITRGTDAHARDNGAFLSIVLTALIAGLAALIFQPAAAGVMSSFGQLLSFVALNHGTISRVALITSMEVIFTMLCRCGCWEAASP